MARRKGSPARLRAVRTVLGWVPIVAAVLVVGVGSSACVKIDSGEAGVKWSAVGGTKDQLYGEGWHLIAPWNRMYVYDMRVQDGKETMHVLSSNGLSITIEGSLRYRVDPKGVFTLHTTVGPAYYETLLAPTLRSEMRKVGGRYQPEEIYSTKRETVEKEISDEIDRALKGRPIIIEAVLVRDVDLPKNIKEAITDKLGEAQRALKMEFTLQREKQEAERKRVEAQGIADFQRIVSEGLTENMLRWKGIEVTERLAQSENAKVIVIGSGKDGMPLILGQ